MPIWQQLFLKRLLTVTLVLAAASELSLDQQAQLTDRVLDLLDPASVATTTVHTSIGHPEANSTMARPTLDGSGYPIHTKPASHGGKHVAGDDSPFEQRYNTAPSLRQSRYLA